jgi:hypothetical protein
MARTTTEQALPIAHISPPQALVPAVGLLAITVISPNTVATKIIYVIQGRVADYRHYWLGVGLGLSCNARAIARILERKASSKTKMNG